MGYNSSTRGYRIWLPQSDKIIESKHVKLDEDNLGNERDECPEVHDFDNNDYLAEIQFKQLHQTKDDTPQSDPNETLPKTLEQIKSEDTEVKLNRITKTRRQIVIYLQTAKGKMLRIIRE